MELPKETRDRIFSAADALFEQNGRDSFPTVDAVRKTARVNMNDASSGMKEWRRAQTAQAAPAAVQVPEAVQAAGCHAVAVLWLQAQELASESLRAAQAGWEGELAELDTVRAELADAYESQSTELDAAQAHITELEKALAKMRESLASYERQAALAGQKAEEIEHRARELRAELDRAHQESDRLRQERDQAADRAQSAEKERDAARDEVLDALTEIAAINANADAAREARQELRKAEEAEATRQAERCAAERDNSRKEASQAREEAAILRGRLEALESVMVKAAKAEI
jgi:chromosome segregation ATPase